MHNGIPVTTPICTLIDLATRLDQGQLESAINEADKRDLIDFELLPSALEKIAPRPGLGVLRKTLDLGAFTLTDSELERRFLPIARKAGLPRPLTQRYVNGFRVDSTGRTWGWSLRPTACATTARPHNRHAIAVATRPIPRPA